MSVSFNPDAMFSSNLKSIRDSSLTSKQFFKDSDDVNSTSLNQNFNTKSFESESFQSDIFGLNDTQDNSSKSELNEIEDNSSKSELDEIEDNNSKSELDEIEDNNSKSELNEVEDDNSKSELNVFNHSVSNVKNSDLDFKEKMNCVSVNRKTSIDPKRNSSKLKSSVLVSTSGIKSIRDLVPSITRNPDAIDACLYMLFKCDDVSEEAKQASVKLKKVLDNSVSNDMYDNIMEKLSHIDKQVMKNERLLRELQLAILFLMAERFDYDVGSVNRPETINFLWDKRDLLYGRLRVQTSIFENECKDMDSRIRYQDMCSGKDIKP